MSRKHDFLKSEQNRDQHPERDQVGSPAHTAASAKGNVADFDKQEPHTGKVAKPQEDGQQGADANQPGPAHTGEPARPPDPGGRAAERDLSAKGRRRRRGPHAPGRRLTGS